MRQELDCGGDFRIKNPMVEEFKRRLTVIKKAKEEKMRKVKIKRDGSKEKTGKSGKAKSKKLKGFVGKVDRLIAILADAAEAAVKFDGGTKTASTTLRKHLEALKKACHELKKAVQDKRNKMDGK